MTSLRQRMLAGLMACALVGVVTAGTAAYWVVGSSLKQAYAQDVWIHLNAAVYHSRVYWNPDRPGLLPAPPGDVVPYRFLVYAKDGTTLLASSEEVPADWLERLGRIEHGDRRVLTLGGKPYRVVGVAIAQDIVDRIPERVSAGPPFPGAGGPRPREGGPGRGPGPGPGPGNRGMGLSIRDLIQEPAVADPGLYAVALIGLDRLVEHQRRILLLFVGVGILALGLAGVLAGLIQRSLLRPIWRIDQAIAAAGPEEHSLGVAVADLPRELQPIVARLDQLMARLADALLRERRTTADIAHELRTPLAALRSGLTFTLLRHGDDPQLAESDAMVAALEARIDALLLLARLTEQTTASSWVPLRLGALVTEAWTTLQDQVEERGLRLEITGPETTILGHRELIEILVANALGNAVAHGDLDAVVSVQGRSEGDRAIITVVNPTSRLAPGDYSQAFSPLWRGDTARSDGERHAGLGMTLVARIAQAHGGSAEARVEESRGFVLTVRLPGQPSDAPAG